jgi:hypothetical protein
MELGQKIAANKHYSVKHSTRKKPKYKSVLNDYNLQTIPLYSLPVGDELGSGKRIAGCGWGGGGVGLSIPPTVPSIKPQCNFPLIFNT